MSIADEIAKIAGGGENRSTHQATVLRTDPDGTTWVSIAGGADETPIHSATADAQPGDTVMVYIAGGRATVGGNVTSPAATVRSVRAVDSRVDAVSGQVEGMRSDVDLASQAAEEAKEVAEATGQHFWEDSNGAHVTEITQDEWKAEEAEENPFDDVSDEKPYHNLLMNSLGILLRTALKNLVSITRSAIAFFDGQGNGAANVVASFGRDGAQIGRQGGYHTSIGVNRFGLLYDIDRLFEVSADGQEVDIYAGGSTMAGGTKYSNAEAAAIFDMLYDTCHGVAGSDIVYVTATNMPSGYRFHEALPFSGSFMIDVIDQDGDLITSGDMNSIFYDGDVTAEWNERTQSWDLVVDARFAPDINYDPQVETAGVTRFTAGDATLTFEEGVIGTSGDATVGGTLDAAGAVTSHGSVFTVTDAIDVDGANPSAVQYSRWFECDDKDGDRIAVFGGARETDGRTMGFFYAYNKNSGGSLVNNHMNFYVDKSGNCTYGLSDPAAFCTTLHVGDRVEKDQKTAVSMADSTWKNICSISLAAGTWIIEATGQYAANGTGRRYLAISETSASASAEVQRQTGNSMNAVSGGTTYIHTGCTKVLTATTTIYLVGWQNSGAALNTYGCITAVRIK